MCWSLPLWIRSIWNPLWLCAKNVRETRRCQERSGYPLSITLPILIHCWDSADLYEEFSHQPIPLAISKTKRLHRPGSPAHNALKEVVFDKNLLKDIQQLTICCHTGNLEVYHSVQTKYATKRQHFSYNGMVARTQWATLDHNANTGRQQATVSRGANQGELQYEVVFPRNTKEWVPKSIFEKTSNCHLKPMHDATVERKCLKPQERSATV